GEDGGGQAGGAWLVWGGGDALRRLQVVREACPRRFEQLPELLVDVAGLADDVARRHQRARLVGGGGTGDEQELTDPERRRECVALRPRPARGRDHVRGCHWPASFLPPPPPAPR